LVEKWIILIYNVKGGQAVRPFLKDKKGRNDL